MRRARFKKDGGGVSKSSWTLCIHFVNILKWIEHIHKNMEVNDGTIPVYYDVLKVFDCRRRMAWLRPGLRSEGACEHRFVCYIIVPTH